MLYIQKFLISTKNNDQVNEEHALISVSVRERTSQFFLKQSSVK